MYTNTVDDNEIHLVSCYLAAPKRYTCAPLPKLLVECHEMLTPFLHANAQHTSRFSRVMDGECDMANACWVNLGILGRG